MPRDGYLTKWGTRSGIMIISGMLLSGPIGLGLVLALARQPGWTSAEIFAQNFRFMQTMPYFFGFLLAGGFSAFSVTAYRAAPHSGKAAALLGMVLTSVFATLIVFNYIAQTTVVPSLVRAYRPEYSTLIAALSMSNPLSVCWGIEMYGYGILGVATWFQSTIFSRNRTERILAGLLKLNGIISVIGAFAASWSMEWLLKPAGLAAFLGWNILVGAIGFHIIIVFRKRGESVEGASS